MTIFLVVILPLLSAGFVAAQEVTITMATDKEVYTTADTITITGTASPVAVGYDVSVIVRDPSGSIWAIGQTSPALSGTWSIANINIVTSSTALGRYTVTATYQGKTALTTFKVEETSKAKIDGPYPLSPKVNDPISFEPHIEGKRTPYDFSWDFGDGQKSIYQNPTWYPESAGTFTVKMEATDPFGNKVSATITVKVN